MTRLLFAPTQPSFEYQYWKSLATVLTALELSIEEESLTEDMSAALCQLTELRCLRLTSSVDTNARTESGILNLDLPSLLLLTIECLNFDAINLKCPQLKNFQAARLSVKSSFAMHSSTPLEELTILRDCPGVMNPEAVKATCLNGRLRRLKIDTATALAGAFSVDASWQAVPQTLQKVTLALPLDEGIPRILEQLLSLTKLSLTHNKESCMHLDRSLDPFLDMPRLKKLKLQSSWNKELMDSAGMCMWTPLALNFLGLAEKRIVQMHTALPKRSVTLIY